jgi:DMSO reductase family type II enzyme heme b subunit
VGNPLSQPEKATPVQKLMGIGPGTLEPFPTQNAVGKGVWQDGRWLVAIGRPLTAADDGEIPLSPGKMYSLAFALWMGSAKDRGARKSITQLGRLTLEA